jgi:iron complex transport system substrate-binding protein
MQIHPDNLSGVCINAALRIHRKFRSGMLESLYEAVLERTLTRDGFTVERQKAISFDFEGDRYDNAFRADLIVNNRLIIEVKARETNAAIYATQLLTYLRLAEVSLGRLSRRSTRDRGSHHDVEQSLGHEDHLLDLTDHESSDAGIGHRGGHRVFLRHIHGHAQLAAYLPVYLHHELDFVVHE